MTASLRPRTTLWNAAIGAAAAGTTAFLVGDDVMAGRTPHAVATLAVIVAWTALWYGTLRDRGGPSGDAGQPLLDRLDRIAAALERSPASASAIAGRPEAEPARVAAVDRDEGAGLLDELKAAQSVSDPVRVLELRDRLAAVLPDDALREVDSQVAKWFMPVIMKRLRTGNVPPDVAALVARVAERFGHTIEGASLRASLPTLRRSAGLCARCARPYRGIADACPICMAEQPPSLVAAEADPDEPEESIPPEDRAFVDPLDPL